MRTDEAAHILGVVGHEVLDVRASDEWWEALVHHGADHTETWVRVRQLPEGARIIRDGHPALQPRKATPRKAAP